MRCCSGSISAPQQALERAPAGVPASIEHIYVYAQNRAAQQRLERFGYARERIFYRMEIEFDATSPRTAIAGRHHHPIVSTGPGGSRYV